MPLQLVLVSRNTDQSISYVDVIIAVSAVAARRLKTQQTATSSCKTDQASTSEASTADLAEIPTFVKRTLEIGELSSITTLTATSEPVLSGHQTPLRLEEEEEEEAISTFVSLTVFSALTLFTNLMTGRKHLQYLKRHQFQDHLSCFLRSSHQLKT